MRVLLLACLAAAALGAKPRCPGSSKAAEGFLRRLLAQLTPKAFFKGYWGKEPVVLTGHALGRDYSGLFSSEELEALVDAGSTSSKRLQKGVPMAYARHLRLDGRSLPEDERDSVQIPEMDASAQPFAGRLQELLQRGWTVIVNQAYSFWEPVLDFVIALERYFEVRVHGNLYITSQGYTGTPIHWDSTDVFFVQVSGRKHWRVWEPFVHETLESHEAPHTAGDKEEEEVWKSMKELLLDVTLEPGDVLYIPRGFLHEGAVPEKAGEGPSVHLTVSPQVETWSRFLSEMPLASMSGQPEPPGKGRFTPSVGFMPTEDFEKLVTLGTPRALRAHLPAPLSRACSGKPFRQNALLKISALDPQVPASAVDGRLADYDGQLYNKGRDGSVVADICRSYSAVLLRGLLSRSKEAAEEGALELEGPLCVSSPVAARLVPSWMSPPGFEKNDTEAVLVHSALNGPVRRSQVAPTAAELAEQPPSLPLKVPVQLEDVLAGALHTEANPSGLVWPRKLMDKAPPDHRAALVDLLRVLLARRVLERPRGAASPEAKRTEL